MPKNATVKCAVAYAAKTAVMIFPLDAAAAKPLQMLCHKYIYYTVSYAHITVVVNFSMIRLFYFKTYAAIFRRAALLSCARFDISIRYIVAIRLTCTSATTPFLPH